MQIESGCGSRGWEEKLVRKGCGIRVFYWGGMKSTKSKVQV